MRLALTAILILAALPLAAEETLLTGTEIDTLLAGRTVTGEGTTQVFYPSGRTLYNDGHDSWGYWETRGDQYCSNWPPQQGWACYDVTTSPEGTVVFIGESGKRYVTSIKND
ncbi:MAG: hypothetical protein AAGE80_14790 [Pseudomonadota bacterium]